jgi:hypothetical protein
MLVTDKAAIMVPECFDHFLEILFLLAKPIIWPESLFQIMKTREVKTSGQ